ncbi:hypothetical protein DQ04_04741040 [Trypanosoma grayi]|uniref:hypothetical protein n=1 Tax=Trypanosoma grayi TaxID=71804 RepID=UPI0004F46282|nr:hypothetical protein DQ04_04741040 [Trypanosoma grayi]KEG09733.1 hypothetical protein DQ04_04741040 [Trypanosoma grayi]
MARGYKTSVWVPENLVQRLQLKFRGCMASSPIGVNAANGRRFFYNISQLDCQQERLRAMVNDLTLPAQAVDCGTPSPAMTSNVLPLNTNGEPFPPEFAGEVFARFAHRKELIHSHYWATVDEAEIIFASPFNTSFLTEQNAVTLNGASPCPRVTYFNVSGTRRPEVFNTSTCCRYCPVNCCGIPYSPVVAVHMKASAIRHGCMKSAVWMTTRRVACCGGRIVSGAKPLTLCFDDVYHLVNIAMTDDPARLIELSLSRVPSGHADDGPLTVP